MQEITDIFASRSHKSTNDVSWILATEHHARTPIQSGIIVGRSNRLMKCWYHIVMLISLSVVQHVWALEKINNDYFLSNRRKIRNVQGKSEQWIDVWHRYVNGNCVALTLMPSWIELNGMNFKLNFLSSSLLLSCRDSMANCKLFNAIRASPSHISANHFIDDSSTPTLEKEKNSLK